MRKCFIFMLMFSAMTVRAEEAVTEEPEIALEELFDEKDLAAFKDEKLDDEELLFEEISKSEEAAEEVFQ